MAAAKKHRSCPNCGGKDRFYLVDKPRSGSKAYWKCRQCDHWEPEGWEAQPGEAPPVEEPMTPERYAAEHGTDWQAFEQAGCAWVRHRWKGRTYDAIRFPEGDGARLRLFDAPDKWVPERSGMQPVLWGFDRACRAAQRDELPLVLVNGQSSVIGMQSNGLPAFTVPGGEGNIATYLQRGLAEQIAAAWRGEIVVMLDGDVQGRKSAPAVVAALAAVGLTAWARDPGDGMDGADFVRLHNGTAAQLLRERPQEPAKAEPVTADEARFRVREEADLDNITPPTWLLPDELAVNAYHLIYGQSGSGKTFYAVDRACRLAALNKRVLYIATEDLAGLRLRVAAWRLANAQAGGRIAWLQMAEGLDLSDPRQVDDLVATIAPYQVDHVTIDTLREAHTGDENSSQDMATVNRAVQRLIRETGASVDVVHHSGINEGRERGSTALAANCDIKIKIANDDGVIAVSVEKVRNSTPPSPRYYQLTPVTTTVVDACGQVLISAVLRPSSQITQRDAPLSVGARKILECLALSIFTGTGAKTSQIGESTGLGGGSLFRALSGLKDRGYISQGQKGDPYTITTSGRAAIGPEYVPTTTPSTASQSATTTTTNQLPPTTTVDTPLSHLLPTTTTTPRGGSGGSERELVEEGDQQPVVLNSHELEAAGYGKCDSCGEVRPGIGHKEICADCRSRRPTIDLAYVRRCIEAGNEQAARVHAAIKRVSWAEVERQLAAGDGWTTPEGYE